MKTFHVKLILEEIEDNASQYRIETYRLRSYETEEEGRALFETAQDFLDRKLN